MSHESPRLAPYRAALQRLSQRTGASVPQLALSFMLLHELTAIVPFGAAFYASSAAGLGERAVDALVADDMQPAWVRDTARRWVDEGGAMAARVGRRYGVFGYEKRVPGEDKAADVGLATRAADVAAGERIAGDVANAIVAYAVVKVRHHHTILVCIDVYGSFLFIYDKGVYTSCICTSHTY
jgi:hypothetical protein